MNRIAAWTMVTWLFFVGLLFFVGFCPARPALANGGPFVVKYPEGDPAAKGVLAPLTDQLKPGREERLKVIKEDLAFLFLTDPHYPSAGIKSTDATSTLPPLVLASAAYTIENPTDNDIEVTFGFPVLRGLYMSPFSMMPHPDARVTLNKNDFVNSTIISNSAIYGMIREQARRTIEEAIAKDGQLSELIARTRATGWVRQRTRATLRAAAGQDLALQRAVEQDPLVGRAATPVNGVRETEHEAARTALREYATSTMKLDKNAAVLLVEYASLDWGATEILNQPPDRPYFFWGGAADTNQWVHRNLGPLSAIGEQKATQLFATLAGRFDPTAANTYESIFAAWGGDVRERSVDLITGAVRPREITISAQPASNGYDPLRASDPTVYARVDYLDPNAGITEAEKDSCTAILKALPVVFTFAPMNLIQYQVRFPARATQLLTVSYKQYAYKDTREPSSYQFAYVLHPASMWKAFGPINLKVGVPAGTPFRASVKCQAGDAEEFELPKDALLPPRPAAAAKEQYTFHRATLQEKTGELFLAADAGAMDRALESARTAAARPPSASLAPPQSVAAAPPAWQPAAGSTLRSPDAPAAPLVPPEPRRP